MNKSEFIEWIENSTSFVKGILFDYEDLINYAEYDFNYLTIEEDKVIFIWEEKYWGGSTTQRDTYTFEEFVELYTSNRL
jgi:hypothetical protein